MSSSLLLRDAHGSIMGYLLIDSAHLCVRISGAGQPAIATISDGMREETFCVHCNGQEEQIPWQSGRDVAGVSIWQEGRMVASGGTTPKNTKPRNESLSEKRGRMWEKEEANHVNINNKERQTVPSLRWPPPPCWQTARYCCGDWIEDDESDGDV